MLKIENDSKCKKIRNLILIYSVSSGKRLYIVVIFVDIIEAMISTDARKHVELKSKEN